jgi:hypothetical protein
MEKRAAEMRPFFSGEWRMENGIKPYFPNKTTSVARKDNTNNNLITHNS